MFLLFKTLAKECAEKFSAVCPFVVYAIIQGISWVAEIISLPFSQRSWGIEFLNYYPLYLGFT